MRIGIFGGSFNPPHKMHKSIAIQLIDNNYLDRVIYVPTGNKYNKKDLIDAKHRLEMLNIMVRDCNKLLVSDYEIKNVLTYTYQTLDYFKSVYPNDEIYFICGSDNLKEITTWRNYNYILDNYRLLIIKRNDDDIEKIVNELNKQNIIITNISSKEISSTRIREKLKLKKEDNNLEKDISRYIKIKNLYC